MDTSNINKKMKSGIIWQSIMVFGQKSVIFLIGIILVRLLTPRDFGIYSLAIFFVAIFEIFTEGGLGVALVQCKELTNEDKNFIFTLNLSLGIMCITILFFSAPIIETYFKAESLKAILRVLSIKIIIDCLRVVSYAEIRRKLHFKEMTLVNIIATTIGGLIAIILLFFNMGIWCLVAQQLLTTITMSVGYYILEPYSVKIRFQSQQMYNLIKFGGGVMLMALLNKITKNIYSLIIGKSYSTEQLGYYGRGISLEDMAISSAMKILGDSGGTILYRLQSNCEEVYYLVEKMLQISGLIIFPILTGMIICAQPLVECLFGTNWLPTYPMLQIICISGFFICIQNCALCIYKTLGNVRFMLSSAVLRQILIVGFAVIVFLRQWSLTALLWSGVGANMVGFLFDCVLCKRLIQFGLLAQLVALWKFIICNFIMGFILYNLYCLLPKKMSCFIVLPMLIICGGILYSILLWVIRAPLYSEYINKFKKYFSL